MSRTRTLAVGQIDDFVSRFVHENRCSDDDLCDIASALMLRAEALFIEIGGRANTAKVFYHLADRLAAPDFDRRDMS